MDPNTQNYFSQYTNYSEVYRKLLSLANDIKLSYHYDRDETSSIKEIIEILKSILIMESIEEYFSNNKTDFYYFMGDFTKDVITYILHQEFVYGENGNELALDLLLNFVELFFKFHKNKDYTNLFENIHKIFDSSSSYYTPSRFKAEKDTKKLYTPQQFNEEYCRNFKKEMKLQELFKIGDKVDVLLRKESSHHDLEKKVWIRGEIKDIKDGNYIIRYPYKENYKEIKYPVEGNKVRKLGSMTGEWDWRLGLKKFDLVDCYDRGKWYPSTVCRVKEFENEYGIYKEYKIGFRLYPDKFLENKEYDYDTFLSNMVFWDNKSNSNDREGNNFYGDSEHIDEDLAFYSKRIQQFQTLSLLQKEALNNQQINNYQFNNNGQNNISLNIQSQNNPKEEKIKEITEILCNEYDGSNEDELFFYEKEGKKNYILGKDNEEFKYYYALLLKRMEFSECYDKIISFLKDKPNIIELSNIFYILKKSENYLHKEFFKENKDLFRMAFFDSVEALSAKDIKLLQKEFIDSSITFLTRVNYIIYGKKETKKSDDINLELSIKLIKSSIFDKKLHGLKMLTEYLKMNLDKDDKRYIIDIIKNNNIIKELFGSNYHTQIMTKSNDILEFMLKNNELTEEDIKLIWSLTEQGDLEAKMTIIKLLSDCTVYLNEKLCNIILSNINIEKITSFSEKEIDLMKNLAMKANDKKFIDKCCQIFCDKIFEINNINILEKSPYVNIIVNFFERDEFCCKRILEICEGYLKENKKVLIVLFLLEKIIEKNKKKIHIKNSKENLETDFISREITKVIDNDKLLIFFNENFESYKKRAKEAVKDDKTNHKNLMIDENSHENNMKYRINFLIKIIPILYPMFDFFSLMKEICLVNPIFESDKSFFYDSMEKFISEVNKDIIENASEEKNAIKEQLFNMLANENKSNISSTQFNLYIKLFLEINSHRNFLTYFKTNENYIINLNNNVNISDIFGMDKLWDLLFELNSENLSQKLINIIYSLYETKKEIQVLLEKCINLIKDSENITYNKLQVCMNILKYIIKDSEKNGIIEIKPHNELLKDCLICLNLEIKKNNRTTYDFYNRMKSKSSKNKGILYGNTTISQIKQILAEKFKMEEKDIDVKIKNQNVTTTLPNHYLNKNLIEIFDLNREGKRGLSPQKMKFSGNFVEKEYLVKYSNVNSKYENMLREWFNIFTNGAEIMDKDAIISYISKIEPDKPVDETNSLYVDLMKYDEGSKSCLLDEEFFKFYIDMAKNDEEKVWEHIKKMGYGKNLEKSVEVEDSDNCNVTVDKNKLPRYILGNDIEFHEALIKLFNKFEKKMNIFEFLFFLCTNEKKYDELLDNSNKLIFVEKQENINYLEELYNLLIIESFIQDLESKTSNLTKIFLESINQNINNLFGTSTESDIKDIKIAAKGYMPFDDEKNMEKKRKFLIGFIEEGGYVKIIKNVQKTLESIENNITDDEKIKIEFCQHCIKLINLLYDSFITKDNKKDKKENKSNDDVFFLYEQIDIVQLITKKDEKDKDKEEEKKEIKEDQKEKDKEEEKNEIKDDQSDKEKDKDGNDNKVKDKERELEPSKKFNKLKEIVINTHYLTLVEKLVLFLLNFHSKPNEPLNKLCFKLFLKLVTSNQKLFEQIRVNENIKKNLSNLIKNNINNKDRFFIKSLMSYIRSLSSEKKVTNNLDNMFLVYLFEITNSLFNELIFNEKEGKKEEINSNSILSFFEFFSDLLKEIIKNNEYTDITKILGENFIPQIYTLLFNNIKEKDLNKKLPEETFIGILKILISIIKDNKEVREQIIYTKINNETLFDIIYNKLIPENDQEEKNNKNLIEDDLDINNLLNQINEDNEGNHSFVKMESLSEIIQIFNSTKKVEQEEVISEKLYMQFKNFIMACLTDCTRVEYILKLLKIISSFSSHRNNNRQDTNMSKKLKGKKEPKRCGYVGLKNIGCICYMNSILQQMYMVVPFRNAIMSADDKKGVKHNSSIYNNNFFDDNLLHQLQRMYTYLTFSEKQAYNPKDFCSSFKDLDGQPINIHLQQDSQEFYNNLCDKIEANLKKTKYKYVIDNIFTGKMCSSVICEKCKTVSNRFEDFYNLSLEVKNITNLYDSLKKFTQPEKIEQFNCEVCKKKVTISKRTSLAKLPNVLFVHLKRFYMNYETEATEKINSRFEFPKTINLKNFCIENINEQESDSIYPKLEAYYEYELKGINVHLGSAEGGHYISFIDVERDGKNNQPNLRASIEKDVIKSRWLKFNDSIVTEFDTKDIPTESYGGFVDDNKSNENCQNAYILIYERKKKTPIKIVIEKENEEKYLTNEQYNIIPFTKETRNSINKYYDISYSNTDAKVKEDDLYNIIFKDEENEECYYYLPYYNIEKKVLKDNFAEVMNKNKKFMNQAVSVPIDLSKYKEKWNDILFSIINTKEFDILNKNYSHDEKKQFVTYFKQEIFNNKILKENCFSLDDEQKIIINDKANILFKKVIMPLLTIENKTEEIYQLLDSICISLTIEGNMKKIFDCKNSMITGIFSIENVKLYCEVMYSIMSLYEFIPRNKINFKDLFQIIKYIKINKEMSQLMAVGGWNSSFSKKEEEEKENTKVKEISGYYYFDLLLKIFKLNNDYVTIVNDLEPIYLLISKIKKNSYRPIRNIIYEIIEYLLEQFYDKNIRNKDTIEKKWIQNKIEANDEEILQIIFDEKSEFLGNLIEILQNKDKNFSLQFNRQLVSKFFNYAKEKQKLIEILNIFFKIINIKDEYILERLYILMGSPNIIIKNEKPKVIEETKKEEEKKKKDEDDSDEEDDDDEKRGDKEEKKKIIFPKFGYSLLEENKENAIYQYRGISRVNPDNCILGQLFPSSDYDSNSNQEKNKNKEQQLTEKERKDYIYKLLTTSLLGEGNYSLFKYIYLTQSRYLKYGNLYEEMLDILSQEKNEKYDLAEIQKNGEICIKRINYEVNKIKSNISNLTGKKIDDDDDVEKEDKETPALPENMQKIDQDSEQIREFTGFYQRHIPDKITKVMYEISVHKDYLYVLNIYYYTTTQDIEQIKKNLNSKKLDNPPIDDQNEIIIEKNESKNEEESEEEDEYNNSKNKIFYKNQIEDDEDLIFPKLITLFKETRGKIDKITIMNEIENNASNKMKGIKSLVRIVLYSNKRFNNFWKGKFEGRTDLENCKCNYYFENYAEGFLKKSSELLTIYRRNIYLYFVKQKSLAINISSNEREESNGLYESF